jgi:L-lactate dehydrogenase complex protein LldF
VGLFIPCYIDAFFPEVGITTLGLLERLGRPVYRGGGLSYGATYSGPIGVILDPGFDLSKYRELPFHSSLCGSCTEVCPIKIDISDQIYKWCRVVAAAGMLRLTKQVGMSALGTTLAHPAEHDLKPD